MYWYIVMILTFFHITEAQNQPSSTSTEDLIDEYYTVVPTETHQFIPQDAADAQAILESQRNEAVIASIFPYREKMRRYAINEQVRLRRKRHTPWIRYDYCPQFRDNQPPFIDLCYALIHHEAAVLASYLRNFFDCKDETYITIGMVLTKDIQNMITVYGDIMPTSFKHQRIEKLKHPFKNMMRVWVRYNRETIEQGNLNQNDIVQDAQTLKTEQENGGWYENRDQIELILMKKSIKYARAVIQEFEKFYAGKPIENMINENIECHRLDKHLAYAYSSLALYIKDKYSYMAGILRQHSDGKDYWAAWIVCIAVVHPQEWPKVDQAFKLGHDGDSLSKFIVQKNIEDKVMAEMIAAIVDSSFKPTTFTKRPLLGQPGAPPPVSPTTIAS